MKPLPLGLTLAVLIIFAGLVVSNSVASQGIAWLSCVVGVLIIIVSILMQNRQNRTSQNHN